MSKSSSQSPRANRDSTQDPLEHAKGSVQFGTVSRASPLGPGNEGSSKLFSRGGDVKRDREHRSAEQQARKVPHLESELHTLRKQVETARERERERVKQAGDLEASGARISVGDPSARRPDRQAERRPR